MLCMHSFISFIQPDVTQSSVMCLCLSLTHSFTLVISCLSLLYTSSPCCLFLADSSHCILVRRSMSVYCKSLLLLLLMMLVLLVSLFHLWWADRILIVSLSVEFIIIGVCRRLTLCVGVGVRRCRRCHTRDYWMFVCCGVHWRLWRVKDFVIICASQW